MPLDQDPTAHIGHGRCRPSMSGAAALATVRARFAHPGARETAARRGIGGGGTGKPSGGVVGAGLDWFIDGEPSGLRTRMATASFGDLVLRSTPRRTEGTGRITNSPLTRAQARRGRRRSREAAIRAAARRPWTKKRVRVGDPQPPGSIPRRRTNSRTRRSSGCSPICLEWPLSTASLLGVGGQGFGAKEERGREEEGGQGSR